MRTNPHDEIVRESTTSRDSPWIRCDFHCSCFSSRLTKIFAGPSNSPVCTLEWGRPIFNKNIAFFFQSFPKNIKFFIFIFWWSLYHKKLDLGFVTQRTNESQISWRFFPNVNSLLPTWKFWAFFVFFCRCGIVNFLFWISILWKAGQMPTVKNDQKDWWLRWIGFVIEIPRCPKLANDFLLYVLPIIIGKNGIMDIWIFTIKNSERNIVDWKEIFLWIKVNWTQWNEHLSWVENHRLVWRVRKGCPKKHENSW